MSLHAAHGTAARALVLLVAFGLTGAARQSAGPSPLRFSLPEKSWAFELTLPEGLEHLGEDVNAEARTHQLQAARLRKKSAPTMIVLEVLLRPAQAEGGGGAHREFAVKRLKKSGGVQGSVKTAERGDVPVIRYAADLLSAANMSATAAYGGFSLKQHTAEAFYARDGVWMSVALRSNRSFGDEEEAIFNAVLDSVKVLDTSAPASSLDHFWTGKTLFLHKQYGKAIAPLSRALALEKQRRQLDPDQFRDLIGHLADAHGAGGNIAAAREVLEYGAGVEPSYPWFHYGLARLHASRGDVDETIAALEKTYASLKGQPREMRPIDPLSDRAFDGVKKDERFRKAVKAMKK